MRTRLFVILAVVVLSVWATYPPRDRIKLGLDLHGGVQPSPVVRGWLPQGAPPKVAA